MATCSQAGAQVEKFRAGACCYEENTIVYLQKEEVTYYGQLTIDQTDGYRYSAVLTNDTAEAIEGIAFYNQRGCQGEHHFKELDDDFGGNKLPFDNMEINTTYMNLTTIPYLLFNIFKKRYAEKLDFITPQVRIKKYISQFVTLTAKWIKTGRRQILKIFTQNDEANRNPVLAKPKKKGSCEFCGFTSYFNHLNAIPTT